MLCSETAPNLVSALLRTLTVALTLITMSCFGTTIFVIFAAWLVATLAPTLAAWLSVVVVLTAIGIPWLALAAYPGRSRLGLNEILRIDTGAASVAGKFLRQVRTCACTFTRSRMLPFVCSETQHGHLSHLYLVVAFWTSQSACWCSQGEPHNWLAAS